MDLIWLLTVIAFLSQQSIAAYIKTTTSGGWTDLRNVCTLATPRIIYSATKLEVDIGSDLHLTERERVWVGYIEDLEVFRFYGCIRQSDVTSQPPFILNTNIGLCYSVCNSSSYFGVRENGSVRAECHCLDTLNQDSLTSCNSANDGDFAFGGPRLLAVYERVLSNISSHLKGLESWNMEDSNCFYYANPAQTIFAWTNCNTSYYFLCTNLHRNPRSNIAGSWKNTANSCFDNNTYPLSYQQNITTVDTSQLWLANVRSMTIISTIDRSASIFRKYGYVERNGNKLNLKFGKQDKRYIGLCQNGTTDAYQKVDDASNESKGLIGAYVGIAIAIVLVIVAVVIGLIIRRKRHASPEKVDNTKRNLTYESSTQPNQNINAHRPDSAEVYHEIQDVTESTNEDYDTIPDGTKSTNEEYDTIPDGCLQKSTQNNNTKVGYFVSEKHANADYEFAREVTGETEHVYDRQLMNTTMAITDDYDHIGKGNAILKQPLGDHPYDTTSHALKQKHQDPKYDHTGDHTTYNHTWKHTTYDHTGDNADYDHTGDHTTFDHTGDHNLYDHTGDNANYDHTGHHANYDYTGDHSDKTDFKR